MQFFGIIARHVAAIADELGGILIFFFFLPPIIWMVLLFDIAAGVKLAFLVSFLVCFSYYYFFFFSILAFSVMVLVFCREPFSNLDKVFAAKKVFVRFFFNELLWAFFSNFNGYLPLWQYWSRSKLFYILVLGLVFDSFLIRSS